MYLISGIFGVLFALTLSMITGLATSALTLISFPVLLVPGKQLFILPLRPQCEFNPRELQCYHSVLILCCVFPGSVRSIH